MGVCFAKSDESRISPENQLNVCIFYGNEIIVSKFKN